VQAGEGEHAALRHIAHKTLYVNQYPTKNKSIYFSLSKTNFRFTKINQKFILFLFLLFFLLYNPHQWPLITAAHKVRLTPCPNALPVPTVALGGHVL